MSRELDPTTRRAFVRSIHASSDSSPVVLGQGSTPLNGIVLLHRPLSRGLIFALLVAACLVSAAGYVAWAAVRNQLASRNVSKVSVAVTAGGPEAIAALLKRPHLVFRSTALGDTFGKIALIPLDAPDGPRTMTTLQCDRVYFSAGRGICLAGYRGIFAVYSAYVFGPDFQTEYTFPLSGIPSRARISPDGRYAAITVFVSGHSYSDGNFSTQTTLIDLATGAMVSELEQFAVTRNGVDFRATDFNFWGVTFARDSNRFYATLASGGKTYLVEGDVHARQARTLYEHVECPSLSPDNTRVAFKKSVLRDGHLMWQLSILDLATLHETPLTAETRSVDDQVEWLDNNHVLYALVDDGPSPSIGENVWVLPTDGSGPPHIFLPKAYSPTVIR
jgi:hypothetical protein